MMDISEMLVLMGFVGACFLAAATGAAFPPGDWYERLAKPPWRPPNWLFGPAWAVLYMTIAVSGWLVWRTAGLPGAVLPIAIYLVQLVLNAAWTPIFFGLHRPDLAFIEIVALWLSIVATMAAFHPVNAAAAWPLLPYLLGHLCCGAQLHNLAPQSRASFTELASVRTSRPQTMTTGLS
jgi:benzodiazapine receptor